MMPSDKPASAHEASSSGQRKDGSLWRVSLPIKRKEKKIRRKPSVRHGGTSFE